MGQARRGRGIRVADVGETIMTVQYDFTSHLTLFCRLLRGQGLLIGSQEIADSVNALTKVEVMDKARVYWALRTVLVSRREEIGVFDQLFDRFWDFETPVRKPSAGPGTGQGWGPKNLRKYPTGFLTPEHDVHSKDTVIQLLRTGASANEVFSEKDLTVLGANELSEFSRIAARMVRALASRPGRRRKSHRRKGAIDLRGALRLSLTTGGDPVRLPRKRRVPRVPRLLVLLDVSGSMDRHTRLLLQLVYAITQHTRHIETFVFSTSVDRVTRQLKAPSFGEALRRVGRIASHWSGGTRIGESLTTLNTEYEALQDRYTTVILLSDGWDTGDPDVLTREIRRMQRRVRRVIWLNPLMGTKDYEPLTRGLQAATPYVDHFVSAISLNSLKRLPQLLRS